MKELPELINFKEVLDDVKHSSKKSLLSPTVKGKYKGYDAEYGVVHGKQTTHIFFRIKLKKSLKLPILLWDRCPLFENEKPLGSSLGSTFSFLGTGMNSESLDVCFKKWVTLSISFSRYEYMGVKNYFEKQSLEDIKVKFEGLTDVAKEIENGTLCLDNIIAKKKEQFAKIFQVVLGIVFVLFIVRYVFIHF